jgi:hypothetical protein
MQKELEEGRQAQEEDISRFRKFVKWLGKEKVGLTGVAVSTAGLITTLLINARGAIIGTAKATSKVAKALANQGRSHSCASSQCNRNSTIMGRKGCCLVSVTLMGTSCSGCTTCVRLLTTLNITYYIQV